MRSDRTLKKWYREANQEYFDSQLPKNTIVRWGTEEEWEDEEDGARNLGDTDVAGRPMEVRLSPVLHRLHWWGIAKITLYHEMIHILLEIKKVKQENDHDDRFEKEMLRLAKLGAFKKKNERSSCLW